MYVQITVHEARDLKPSDPNGLADPYVVLNISTQQYITKTIHKSLNPKWGETFTLDCSQSTKLLLTVWDKDVISDDFLGHVVIDLSRVRLDGSDEWYKLLPRHGKKEKVTGDVRLSFVPGAVQKRQELLLSTRTAPASDTVRRKINAARQANSTELDLAGMNLESVPSELVAFVDWTILDLSFNAFSNFPEIFNLVALQELFLIGNQIEVIPPNISRLQSLKVLFMTGNQLKSVCSEIGALTNLEKLSFANNQLRELPPELGNLKKLEELNLSGNPLDSLPNTMNRLEYLEILDLNGCGLRELPETFGNMPRLLELNLGTNKLQALPDNFGNLTRLVTLNLADNEIKELPISMGRMINLANIYLERNPIKDEELLAKYKIGTDHLVDWMEKRLFFREQELKRIQKEREDRIQKVRNPVVSTDDENEEKISKLRKTKPKVLRYGYNEDENIENLPPEEKVNRIRFASLELVQEVKQGLVDLKRALASAKTMEEILPLAKSVRDLIFDVEQAKAHIPPIKKPFLPPPGPNESKVDTLKKTTAVALKEVEDIISSMITTLATRIPENQVTALARISKSLSEKMKKILENISQQPK